MSKIIRLTESEMVTLIEKVIKEQYDSKKLYNREHIVNRVKNGPKELKKYIRELPYIDCSDGQGNSHVCTTIPEVIHVFLSGRYWNMGEEKLIKAYSKLINSDILKSVYPMLDHIDIAKVKDNPNFIGYDMSVNIFLNDPNIDKNNMYAKKFDPHYLVEKHLKDLSKYLGIDFHKITFKLYSPDGELILNWD